MLSAHVPVLLDEVTEWLAPAAPGLLVDVTVGLGGHAAALLEEFSGFRLLGLDRDPEAIEGARRRLQPFSDRVRLVNRPFDQIRDLLVEFEPPAAILADLGCSSLQLDSPGRGFSFLTDGPLDMRMGDVGPTAAELVNAAPEEELVRILGRYSPVPLNLHLTPVVAYELRAIGAIPDNYDMVMFRRFMFKTAHRLAGRKSCLGLVSGDSLEQEALEGLEGVRGAAVRRAEARAHEEPRRLEPRPPAR